MAAEAGVAVRVGGMRRFYALLLLPGKKVRLLRCADEDRALAEADLDWEPNRGYLLSISVKADLLVASVDGREIFRIRDGRLPHGAIALVNTEGRTIFREIEIEPA
jgi:hypothetical protein